MHNTPMPTLPSLGIPPFGVPHPTYLPSHLVHGLPTEHFLPLLKPSLVVSTLAPHAHLGSHPFPRGSPLLALHFFCIPPFDIHPSPLYPTLGIPPCIHPMHPHAHLVLLFENYPMVFSYWNSQYDPPWHSPWPCVISLAQSGSRQLF